MLLARILPIVLALLAACSVTHYTQIRHPLHVGQVDPNTVTFTATRMARSRGIPPQMLVDKASLVEVNGERVCADIALWSLETNPARGVMQNYSMSLLTNDDDVHVTSANVQVGAPQVTPIQGFVMQMEATGTQPVCTAQDQTGACIEWQRETIYQNVRHPHVWQVTSHPARVCFPNQGFVNPGTQRVSLEMQARGDPTKFVFEWEFTSALSG